MKRSAKLVAVLPKIELWFSEQEKSIYTYKEICSIFRNHKHHWNLSFEVNTTEFFQALLDAKIITKKSFIFGKKSFNIYCYSNPTLWEQVSNMSSNTYISHFSASFIHDLTEQIPKKIYISLPQKNSNKSRPLRLSEDKILESMQKPLRHGENQFSCGNHIITLVNNQQCSLNIVKHINHPIFGKIKTSSLEKTLIDIAVRPEYSGGIFEVIKAYEAAGADVSVVRMRRILRDHKFAYPYHQAIGFYMEKSKQFSKDDLDFFRKENMKNKFILKKGLAIEDCNYVEKWNLYVPKEISSI